ncbi:hypothetical protein I302_102992 [Kwoniella bestiolae CBS 10118]|uniref:Uncharacterized protein n=1 Tax=Kwoniella bestiolae CBS 10118 TaxID=1296100 RepID=A0A1B9GGI8_9TREE|nr:hypothetical protein I302_01688 [Kwoniella bestiolae CBS 10118]OCF30169.1 hypothetical protein I302_01688 [Kwoniella bestiolae CBS 10118]
MLGRSKEDGCPVELDDMDAGVHQVLGLPEHSCTSLELLATPLISYDDHQGVAHHAATNETDHSAFMGYQSSNLELDQLDFSPTIMVPSRDSQSQRCAVASHTPITLVHQSQPYSDDFVDEDPWWEMVKDLIPPDPDRSEVQPHIDPYLSLDSQHTQNSHNKSERFDVLNTPGQMFQIDASDSEGLHHVSTGQSAVADHESTLSCHSPGTNCERPDAGAILQRGTETPIQSQNVPRGGRKTAKSHSRDQTADTKVSKGKVTKQNGKIPESTESLMARWTKVKAEREDLTRQVDSLSQQRSSRSGAKGYQGDPTAENHDEIRSYIRSANHTIEILRSRLTKTDGVDRSSNTVWALGRNTFYGRLHHEYCSLIEQTQGKDRTLRASLAAKGITFYAGASGANISIGTAAISTLRGRIEALKKDNQDLDQEITMAKDP